MRPSFVDVGNELLDLVSEAGHLANRLARIGDAPWDEDTQERWEATLVCASAAEKLYTGCERVMARIAAEVDGMPVAHTEGWHAALLRRVANPVPGVRGAVISGECHAALNVMRAFRHRERNTYGIQMDFGIVVERAREAVHGFRLFKADVERFYGRDDDAPSDTDG